MGRPIPWLCRNSSGGQLATQLTIGQSRERLRTDLTTKEEAQGGQRTGAFALAVKRLVRCLLVADDEEGAESNHSAGGPPAWYRR